MFMLPVLLVSMFATQKNNFEILLVMTVLDMYYFAFIFEMTVLDTSELIVMLL